eukprot:PhM_4_TR9577/c0_g1_i1/m.61219
MNSRETSSFASSSPSSSSTYVCRVSIPDDVDLYFVQRSPLTWHRLSAAAKGPAEHRALRSAIGITLIEEFSSVCTEIESLLEILVDYRAETSEEINIERKRRETMLSLAPAGRDLLEQHLRMIEAPTSQHVITPLHNNRPLSSSSTTSSSSSSRPRTATREGMVAATPRHVDPLQNVPQAQLRFDKLFHESSWLVDAFRHAISEEIKLLVSDTEWLRELIFDEQSYRFHVTKRLSEETTACTSLSTLRSMSQKAQHAARIQALPDVGKGSNNNTASASTSTTSLGDLRAPPPPPPPPRPVGMKPTPPRFPRQFSM